LSRYFRSGWVFLMPYLGAFLIYSWMGWPVNTPSDSGVWGWVSLLHVYWFLHCGNLIFGLFALRAYCREPRQSGDFTHSIIPWALLGLLFLIPGTYLEFPSDPWEHLRRIDEWKGLLQAASSSDWAKSGYFLTYSLTGWTSPRCQSMALSIFSAAVDLLLCWQYYRLAKAIGIGRRKAFIFVVLQSVIFGNSSFAFFRYYGLASTLFSQIAAIALIRIGVVAAPSLGMRGRKQVLQICSLGIASVCLVLLIVFNHLQGVGIAGLGLVAVAIWRLLQWNRSAIGWLCAGAAVLSLAAILWFPRHHALDDIYRKSGVFSAWYGFNIFLPFSQAGVRAIQILGFFGGINLLAGAYLAFRNNLVGWLTVIPFVALGLPFVSIPLSELLAPGGDWAVFQRMLFAIPMGMAIVCLIPRFNAATALVSLLALFTVPSGAPFFNRVWNAYAILPDDLTLAEARNAFREYARSPDAHNYGALLGSTAGLGYLSGLGGFFFPVSSGRLYPQYAPGPSSDLALIRTLITPSASSDYMLLCVPRPEWLYTPYSSAGISSNHWHPQQVALAFSGAREMTGMSNASSLLPYLQSGPITFLQSANPLLTFGNRRGMPIHSGLFSCQVGLTTSTRPWMTLLAIDSDLAIRAVYIYASSDSGLLFYDVGGRHSGPSGRALRRGRDEQLVFTWGDRHQKLLLDGITILESSFPAPKGAIQRVCVGWNGTNTNEMWTGGLQPNDLKFSPQPNGAVRP